MENRHDITSYQVNGETCTNPFCSNAADVLTADGPMCQECLDDPEVGSP